MTAETNKSTDCYAFGIMLWECFEIPYNSPYRYVGVADDSCMFRA